MSGMLTQNAPCAANRLIFDETMQPADGTPCKLGDIICRFGFFYRIK